MVTISKQPYMRVRCCLIKPLSAPNAMRLPVCQTRHAGITLQKYWLNLVLSCIFHNLTEIS